MTEQPSVIVFGYHEVGTACLELLIARGVPVAALVTHADDPGEEIWFRTPASVAEARGIPVFRPDNPNTPKWRALLQELRPQVLLSCYYRQMLGPDLLALCPLGAFNLHGSLLPRYRGRVPINWAIIHGEPETGATLHRMTVRADAGDIVDQERVPIGSHDTAQEVFARVTVAARTVLDRSLAAILAGTPPQRPQDEANASYFGGRRPQDGRIDWRWDANRIFNLIRAVTHPYPGAFTSVAGKRLYIWWAEPCAGSGPPGSVLTTHPMVIAAGRGALAVRRAQWEGAPEQDADVLEGLLSGMMLDQSECGDS